MKFHRTELSNGLTLLGEVRESAVSAAIGFFVRTGARDETDDVSGVSHFLEHMMFKGTATRSALDVAYELGAMGAQSNAYTSEESTVYYMAILPEYFERGMDLLCDMLQPALDPQEFSTEKKVILEEIALYQDRPSFMIFENLLRTFFDKHPAGNSVLGSHDSISALPVEKMRTYFDGHYSTPNMALVASGNFNWNKFVDLAGKLTEKYSRAKVTRQRPPHTPSPIEKIIHKDNLQLAHMCLAAKGPMATDDSRYAAKILSCILGDGSGSRTFWELVDKGLVDAAAIDDDEMDQVGMIYGYVSAPPERLDEVGAIMRRIMETPLEFDAGMLERAKTKLRTRVTLQGESSMARMSALGHDWLDGNPYQTLEQTLARLEAVSRDEIAALVKQYPLSPTAIVKLLPA